RGVPWALLAAALLVSAGAFTLIWMGDPAADFDIAAPIVTGVLLYAVALTVASRLVEGSRRAVDRLMTTLVTLAFVIALLPLISLAFTVITRGLARLDLDFFTMSMRN